MRALLNSSLFVCLIAVGVGQTPSAQPDPSPSPPVVVTDRDYAEMLAKVTKLSAQDIVALRDKALAGDANAAAELGMAYQVGCPGANMDANEAVRWYRLAADHGSSIAANQLGVYNDPEERFAGAKGHDAEEALRWYRKSAERGDNAGEHNVGLLLEQMKRYPEAADWYRKLVEKGDPMAAVHLVVIYDDGKALPGKSKKENRKEALDFFQDFANKGNAGAEYVVGEACQKGLLGLNRDLSQGLEWLRKAAEQQMPIAELAMGDIYFNGNRGVPRDKGQGIDWWLKAANHENATAALSLALTYDQGDGTPKDPIAAYMWYELAREWHAPGTRIPRNAIEAGDWVRLRHHYTDTEVQEGRKKLQEWKTQHGPTISVPD